MPDIAMCKGIRDGKSCPRLHECYRHTAKPDERRQTHLAVAPFDDAGQCAYLWPLTKERRL